MKTKQSNRKMSIADALIRSLTKIESFLQTTWVKPIVLQVLVEITIRRTLAFGTFVFRYFGFESPIYRVCWSSRPGELTAIASVSREEGVTKIVSNDLYCFILKTCQHNTYPWRRNKEKKINKYIRFKLAPNSLTKGRLQRCGYLTVSHDKPALSISFIGFEPLLKYWCSENEELK